MKELHSFPNGSVQYDKDNFIILMKFFGDIPSEVYKSIWRTAVDTVFDYGVEKIIIDQSGVTHVPKRTRAWVVTSMYPKVKRDLSPDLAVSVVAASNPTQRSGVNYLVKGARAISGFYIDFHKDYKASTEWLNSIHPS